MGLKWSLGMVSPRVWIWYWVVEWQQWFWPLLFISFYDLGPGCVCTRLAWVLSPAQMTVTSETWPSEVEPELWIKLGNTFGTRYGTCGRKQGSAWHWWIEGFGVPVRIVPGTVG